MTHPSSCHDPDCTLTYRQHLLGIGVSCQALPTRKRTLIGHERKEQTWNREHDAYRRLRADGLQPPRSSPGANGEPGPREFEQRAECAEQVNTGLLNVKPRAFDVFHEETGKRATEPQTRPVTA